MSASDSSPLDNSTLTHFEQVSITCTNESFAPIAGAEVVMDHAGVHMPGASDEALRAIKWSDVKSSHVDWWTTSEKGDIQIGVLLTLHTELASYALGLPGQDKLQVSSLVSRYIQSALAQETTNLGSANSIPDIQNESSSRTLQDTLEKDSAKKTLFDWDHVQFVLVLVLIALIFTAVTLILAQSAGAIHLRFLSDAAFNNQFLA